MEAQSQTQLFEVFSEIAERLEGLPQVRIDTVLTGLFIQSAELRDEHAAMKAGTWYK